MAKVLLIVLNKLFELNPGSKGELQKFAGKTLYLNCLGISFSAKIGEDGVLDNYTNITPGSLDTIIVIPVAVLKHLLEKDQLGIFQQMQIAGDPNFARNFLQILAKLNLSGLYAKLSPAQAVIFYQLEKLINGLKSYFMHITSNMGASLSEYMLYESGDIINKHELEKFYTEVDLLKARTDLLEKKVANLMSTKSCD